jgi:pyruvate/2-oxoglutarate dehydrogenase complex dihydrolipoamide acyltransferase (E2) component
MSTQYPAVGIHLSVSDDKATAATRITRGVMITNQAPQSTLYQAPEIKAPVDGVVQATVVLKGAVDDYHATLALLAKARTALGAAIAAWDGAYDILVVSAEKRCATPDDGASLALPVRERTRHTLAMPLSIDLRYDAKLDTLRIHVHHAPGMRSASVEISQDPSNPASWKELDGHGARHVVPHPEPGIWWVRAAARVARAKSDYTTPVSIIVR